MRPNLKQYHQSISNELEVLKDRIRLLIGNRHWQTDGEHKESVLRKVLKNHVAETLRIGRGFVCYPEQDSSRQLDILITDRNKPTLFKDEDLILATPDAIKAIIEVKTKLSLTELRDTVNTLSEQIQKVRQYNMDCLAGLFVFETQATTHKTILQVLQQAAANDKTRMINWVAMGPDLFFRFWPEGSHVDGGAPIREDVWHSYNLTEGLAHAYFVSNVVWETSTDNNADMQFAWFPIEGGKEPYREAFIRLAGGDAQSF